ncbi:ABC transporter permease [Actinophytocola algeriensis]|uniref:Peptide/nickel transport system permease protein n=1 Tax=Actinophytocola algeriensis TaxID=1768010 RepID=A0A7W7VCS0_9PSEU|nr:ABC transporter permease [Actinophytocola algeriensis]MBB4905416.1 peptide/nickel transport system permease protein [Actinophytocola algeriensis]MBE1472899.1 peptide/nickel transport system permease protein [Actinophytocola algeriensis]
MIILRMLLGRVLSLVPLLLGVTLFVFIVMRFSPVDPALAAFDGANATDEQLEQFRRENGLLDPWPVQYGRFVWNLLHGDFGVSVITKQSVGDTITTALPLTLQLTLMGVVIAIVVSLLLGITSAVFRDRWPDQLIRIVSLAGVAAPAFWIALLLVQWLAVGQGLFPSSGYVSPQDSFSGWLNSMTLPAIALAMPVAAQLTRVIRTSMVEELDKDYVRTARGGGLPPVVVVGRNVLRNALVTPLTVLGLRVGYLLGGAVVIETMFALPGLGQNMIQAVNDGDTSKVQGFVITIAIGFVLVNLIVDILYVIANPRLRSHS